MGLSATAFNMFRYTERENTLGRNLMSLTNQKAALAREMQEISKKHNEDLRAITLKWSPNSGVTYMDLSYKNIMYPSMMNSEETYLLTDVNGRVVIDDKYQKYAEMISAKGTPGGDWKGNRTQILSELTGIESSKIEGAGSLDDIVLEKQKKLDEVLSRKPKTDSFKNQDLCCLLEKMGSSTGASNGAKLKDADDWADAYQHGGTINLGSSNADDVLSSILDNLSKTLSPYLKTEKELSDPNEVGAFPAACAQLADELNSFISSNTESRAVKKDGDNFVLDVQKLMDMLMAYYPGETVCNPDGTRSLVWYDTISNAYDNYVEEYSAWQTEYNAAHAEFDGAIDSNNMLLTAEEEKKIKFYDDLFSTVAEKGWVYNADVNDNEYLNNMLQNNILTLTNVRQDKVYDEKSEKYYMQNAYDTDIATNNNNIFAVNDSYARDIADSEYEDAKARINAKETKIDFKIEEIKTETASIKTILQSLGAVKDEWIDRSFNTFA